MHYRNEWTDPHEHAPRYEQFCTTAGSWLELHQAEIEGELWLVTSRPFIGGFFAYQLRSKLRFGSVREIN